MKREFPLHLVALVAVACGGARPRFESAEFTRRGIAAAEVRPLMVHHDEVGVLRIASSAFYTEEGAQRLPVVHVRLVVGNRDAAEFRVPLRSIALEGVAEGALAPAAIFADRAAERDEVVVPSGETRAIDVVFELPPGVEPEDVREFRVRWGVDLPGRAVRAATLFRPAPAGTRGTGLFGRVFAPVTM